MIARKDGFIGNDEKREQEKGRLVLQNLRNTHTEINPARPTIRRTRVRGSGVATGGGAGNGCGSGVGPGEGEGSGPGWGRGGGVGLEEEGPPGTIGKGKNGMIGTPQSVPEAGEFSASKTSGWASGNSGGDGSATGENCGDLGPTGLLKTSTGGSAGDRGPTGVSEMRLPQRVRAR